MTDKWMVSEVQALLSLYATQNQNGTAGHDAHLCETLLYLTVAGLRHFRLPIGDTNTDRKKALEGV